MQTRSPISRDLPLGHSLAQLLRQRWLCPSKTATVPFELQAGALGSCCRSDRHKDDSFAVFIPSLPIQQPSHFFSLSLCIQALEHFARSLRARVGFQLTAVSPRATRWRLQGSQHPQHQAARQGLSSSMLPSTTGLVRPWGWWRPCAGPWKYPPTPLQPGLSLTVLYLKGHCSALQRTVYICYRGSRRGREGGQGSWESWASLAVQRCLSSSAARGWRLRTALTKGPGTLTAVPGQDSKRQIGSLLWWRGIF